MISSRVGRVPCNRGLSLRSQSNLIRQHRLRARQLGPISRYCVRWATTIPTPSSDRAEKVKTPESDSGHIEAKSNESILWFDNLFPLKLTVLLRAPWAAPDQDIARLTERFNNSTAGLGLGFLDPMQMIKRTLSQDLPVDVKEVLPRLKDGGAFVKFSHPAKLPAAEVEDAVAKSLARWPIKPFFNPLRAVHAGLVRGVPWLEDLHRFPSGRLRIEFVPKRPGEEAVELSQEDLYSLFRRYGKIAEIVSQPFDSKVVPKFAYVDFAFVRDAIMARNCLHGFVVPAEQGGGSAGTKLRMSYEVKDKGHNFWDWMVNHPRIVIPALVAILTGFTVVVFDPIRSFFVKAHVQRTFRLSNSKFYRWLRRQTSDILDNFSKRETAEKAGLNAVWSHRRDIIDQLQTWLMETAETFIVVQGPRGSGKKELILEQALKTRSNVLVIDCKPIVDARGESSTIKHMAAQVGYRPIFSWANSVSSMVELAVQSTTGVKAGFSETLESQLQKILSTTAAALTEIDLSARKKGDADFTMSPDSWLEAHPEKRAVVIIDNFLHKGDANPVVYDKIAEWAAALVQSNIAHVIFLTTDSSYSKSLSKSLPDRVFRQVTLGDLSPDVAKHFITSHLAIEDEVLIVEDEDRAEAEKAKNAQSHKKHELKLDELDDCIGALGGRLTDLEYLARRLKAGQSPKRAVDEMTEQAASEILKMFLLPGSSSSSAANGDKKQWSVEQAWYLVKALASGDSLRYNEVVLTNTFASSLSADDGDAAIEALANADLVAVKRSAGGRPTRIVAGKPVYEVAFAALARDPVLVAKLDLALDTELAKIEGKTIDKCEAELALLATLPGQGGAARVKYLMGKLQKSQEKVEMLEGRMGDLKKILGSEY